MSGKYIDPEATGYEPQIDNRKKHYPRGVKNLYCPVDGHYCEQPNCENCNFERLNDER